MDSPVRSDSPVSFKSAEEPYELTNFITATPGSCEKCKHLGQILKQLNGIAFTDYPRKGTPQLRERIPHYDTWAALAASAETCPLCSWLWADLRNNEVAVTMPYGALMIGASIHKQNSKDFEYFIVANIRSSDSRAPDGKTEFGYVSGFVAYANDRPLSTGIVYEVFGRRETPDSPFSPAKSDGVAPLRNRETALDFDVELVKSWIRLSPTEDKKLRWSLPTRVLEVGTMLRPKLRLVKGSQYFGQYMTLSHCWGRKRLLTTTKDNLQQHETQITYESLGKTFKDAVLITRLLDVRYLWIDSLCIVQDDPADWAVEASLMSSVYLNSSLNIAATSSKDNDGGCIFPRSLDDRIYLSSTLGVRRMINGFDEVVNNGVLNKRAWVVQERVLAPRTLHCTSERLFWEAGTHFYSEDGPNVQHDGLSLFDPHEKILLSDDKIAVTKTTSLPEIEKFHHWQWRTLIRYYTACQLTYQADMLPAISGLAALFGKTLGDDYVAGLWRNDLVHGMCWNLDVVSPNTDISRDRPYVAPSWSWAATTDPKYYSHGEIIHKVASEDKEMVIESMPMSVVVKEVHVVPEGDSPFGRVISGWVILTGQARKIVKGAESCYTLSPSLDPLSRASFDNVDDLDDSAIGLLLLHRVREAPSTPRSEMVLLILISAGADQWKRVGLAYVWEGFSKDSSDLWVEVPVLDYKII